MIHIKVLESHFKGLNFDIEQNVIISPSGSANRSVKLNNFIFS